MKFVVPLFFALFSSAFVFAEEVTECDRLAAHPSDPGHVGAGVSSGDVDTGRAIEACEAAVAAWPDNPRFHYQLGRALVYDADKGNGDTLSGLAHLERASDMQYPQAMFVLGLMHRRAGDVCASEPLTKSAADKGLKSARITYANSVISGEYASCRVTASRAEIDSYLQMAEVQVSGYYEDMLLRNLDRQLGYNSPVTSDVWSEAVVSVTDLDRSAQFFVDIGGYEEKWRGRLDAGEIMLWGLEESVSGEALLLGPAGQESGMIRLIRFDNTKKTPTRPGARAWDTGCYFSLMVRMKDIPKIYNDAVAMGWWSETPMTYLEFGESKLNVMVFRGPDGVQIQGYERLAPPLPAAIPDFERITRPFNIMQMVRDRDVAYSFFTEVLGFASFYNGKPYVSEAPEYMPLGIPKNLTTSVRYRASIVYPQAGEFGRMEMIEIMDLDGHDYADRCDAPNLGILAVRYPVEDVNATAATISSRDWPLIKPATSTGIEPYGEVEVIAVKTPDGANIQFYESMH